jgi:hypothetical protein
MAAVAGSLYLVSTTAFCLFCLAIGVRLLLLARRTRGRPELLLGLGLGLTGGIGYGILIAVSLARTAAGAAPAPALTAWGLLGKGVHDVGVLAMLGFILTVFRPGETWARALAGAMAAVLLVGYVGNAVTGGFAESRPQGFWYWLGFSAIGTYPMWMAAEAFRYHGLMRKRSALGLADPVVVNRFLLWGIASLFSVAAIWTISFPAILGKPLEEQVALAPLAMSITALWGIGAISAYWLTFFPPAWYRARIAAAPR